MHAPTRTHDLIVSPFLDEYLVLRPGDVSGVKIKGHHYLELQQRAHTEAPLPAWLHSAARRRWGLNLADRPVRESLLIRDPSPYGHGRASYEVNNGCNWACDHCVYGAKRHEGLAWSARARLLRILRDAGVLWVELGGGEATIDKHFPETYALAYDLGMMVEILTNGSTLFRPHMLDLLTNRPPYRVTLSVYGATEDTFDRFTNRRGAFKKFMRGLAAAREAGLPLSLSVVITEKNAHEAPAMRALAERFASRVREYTHMSPTFTGDSEPLAQQAPEYLHNRTPFTGCDAGHTSLNVNPFGLATVCKVSRDHPIPLLKEGVAGLARLGGISDRALQRHSGCSGCALQKTCTTCMPLVNLYRKAGSSLDRYCQHA
ncbi:radical SAM protein [Streptomyces nigrescens]|uniref:Radical SAM protein n=1 Tax=Streptomyces nigrescens TaxID=1920 RepID=A0ABY7J7R1_STRNI|nr:radical SAM protein [Streptomyces nigrescens]WAU06064.1 radical SAM protein [Streptomyces nigrescens]WAU09965.1 radical SAM protein [Streptomyces nigrescens]